MPELPEVESVCRLMERLLKGKRIVEAEVAPDEIVLKGVPAEAIQFQLIGSTVTGTGRKGKYWWIELDRKPWLFGHLGMSGWIRQIGGDSIRLHSHGEAPLDDSEGRPKFLKLRLVAEDGAQVVFTDGRRLGRLWLSDSPEVDAAVSKLGFDVYRELPTTEALFELVHRRKTPIKALLLDQAVFAGVGNWIADEVLYHSRIAPKRVASMLSLEEVIALRAAVEYVVGFAVDADADYRTFPAGWLFHHRWGGGKGAEFIEGHELIRETVGGRTTAWVPSVQR